jgi:predicted dinucleotide-binding enzyme
MKIAIIGTGFIATTLGRPLTAAGHAVTFGTTPERARSYSSTTCPNFGSHWR